MAMPDENEFENVEPSVPMGTEASAEVFDATPVRDEAINATGIAFGVEMTNRVSDSLALPGILEVDFDQALELMRRAYGDLLNRMEIDARVQLGTQGFDLKSLALGSIRRVFVAPFDLPNEDPCAMALLDHFRGRLSDILSIGPDFGDVFAPQTQLLCMSQAPWKIPQLDTGFKAVVGAPNLEVRVWRNSSSSDSWSLGLREVPKAA